MAQCLNCKPGFFTQMVPTVVEHFKAAFPELEAKEKFVMQVIKDEEDQEHQQSMQSRHPSFTVFAKTS